MEDGNQLPTAANEEEGAIPVGLGWSACLVRQPDGVALVRVSRHDTQPLEIEIRMTSSGPMLRARAHAIELEATHEIRARCERFAVDASKGIELRSGGDLVQTAENGVRLGGAEIDVAASRGDVRLKANDDVQLKGEMVLLNCDRPEPAPSWTGAVGNDIPPTLPVADASGDVSLLRRVPR
jgi:hypothetical protein